MIRAHLREFLLSENAPAPVDSRTSLRRLTSLFPHTEATLKKFGVTLIPQDHTLNLEELVRKYELPPPQILFMEIQLSTRLQHITKISVSALHEKILRNDKMSLIDAREGSELHHGKIKGGLFLDNSLWEEIETQWERSNEIIVYCHFGIRSLDVACALSDLGFKKISALEGGIDAWATQIETTLKRYSGNYC